MPASKRANKLAPQKNPVKHVVSAKGKVQPAKKKRVFPGTEAQRYILLPAEGMQATSAGNPEIEDFLSTLSTSIGKAGGGKLVLRSTEPASAISIKVIDSIHENGAKLVSIDDDQLANFRLAYPGLIIVPEVFYELENEREVIRAGAYGVKGGRKAPLEVKLRIVDQGG